MKSRASAPLVSRRELAGILGRHMQTITKWEQEGLPVRERGRKGRASLYSLEDVQIWLSAREEVAKAPGGALYALQARADKDHWQARLAQQTHGLRSGSLLPTDQVERGISGALAAVRARLLAVPVGCADRIERAARLEGAAGVQRVLEDAVDNVLEDLSRFRISGKPDGQHPETRKGAVQGEGRKCSRGLSVDSVSRSVSADTAKRTDGRARAHR